jgi:hypothetical protein
MSHVAGPPCISEWQQYDVGEDHRFQDNDEGSMDFVLVETGIA